VESTNKQKTISLKQAQAMNQRPPELMSASSKAKAEQTIDEEEEENNLQIDGLNISNAQSSDANSFEDAKVSLDQPDQNGIDKLTPDGLGDLGSPLLPDPLTKTESK
jgi:hypothetical protein